MGLFGLWTGGSPSPALPASISAVPIELASSHDDDSIETIKSNNDMQMQVRLKDKFLTCVNVEAQVDVPHHVVFDILANPNTHAKVFSAIKEARAELVEESGSRRTWHLDYKTYWKFWKVGGVCDQKVLMLTDRDSGTVSFKLREPGFLKVYEGTWIIKPAAPAGLGQQAQPTIAQADGQPEDDGMFSPQRVFGALQRSLSQLALPGTVVPSGVRTTVLVEKMMAPRAQPPYPLNLALKGTAAGQVQEMVSNLFASAKLQWPVRS